MSSFINFYSRAMTDRNLADRLEQIGIKMARAKTAAEREAVLTALLELAAEEGFFFSKEDLLNCLTEGVRELSDADMFGVSGGEAGHSGLAGEGAEFLKNLMKDYRHD